MPHMMQKHVSRREMQRRIDQGRQAIKVLAAAIVEAGGTLRISRDVFEGLPLNHKMSVERDALTGDLILRADTSHRQELTFEEIRARYGTAQAPERTEAADEAGRQVRHPDDQPQ